MAGKEDLHKLVDQLTEGQTEAAARFLDALRENRFDPVSLALLLAPESNEPLTEAEQADLAWAEEDEAVGRIYSTDEVRRRILRL
jgi:hypothetical protein